MFPLPLFLSHTPILSMPLSINVSIYILIYPSFYTLLPLLTHLKYNSPPCVCIFLLLNLRPPPPHLLSLSAHPHKLFSFFHSLNNPGSITAPTLSYIFIRPVYLLYFTCHHLYFNTNHSTGRKSVHLRKFNKLSTHSHARLMPMDSYTNFSPSIISYSDIDREISPHSCSTCLIRPIG